MTDRLPDLDTRDDDDPAYVDWAASVIGGVLGALTPAEAYIVKIDSWFGQRWLAFSHKAMGALSVHFLKTLRVPPFVPGRVVSERAFVHAPTPPARGYHPFDGAPRLHLSQPSEANERRLVSTLFPRAALFWWTGATRESGRGTLMAYVPTYPADTDIGETIDRRAEGHAAWYCELARTRDGTWRISRTSGISPPELSAMANVVKVSAPSIALATVS